MVRRKKHDLFLHALSLVLLTISMSSFAENDTLRHPAAGPISGAVNENGTLAWLGIPYAQAPIGNLRWKAPRALTPFHQVFTATTFADMCTQLGNPLLDIDPSLYGKAVGSEDCLYLNIWSPPGAGQGRAGEQKLPVMVWVHGGSNVGGSSRIYYPGNLVVHQNVVVVSVNYRLGLFGWFMFLKRAKMLSAIEPERKYRPLLYSLDLFLPLIDLGYAKEWTPNQRYI